MLIRRPLSMVANRGGKVVRSKQPWNNHEPVDQMETNQNIMKIVDWK